MDNHPKVLLAALIAFIALVSSVSELAAQQEYGIFTDLKFEDEVKPMSLSCSKVFEHKLTSPGD